MRAAFGLMLCPPIAVATAQAQPSSEEARDYVGAAAQRLTDVLECRNMGEADEIVVCGRVDAPEPYRLPIRPEGFDPKANVDSVSRERHRLMQEGDAGIGSCSTVGPGGYTGCFHQRVKRRCQQETCGVAF